MFALIGVLLATSASAFSVFAYNRDVTLDKYWELSFTIRPTMKTLPYQVPREIVRVNAEGKSWGSGSKIPAVSFLWWSKLVQVCMSCDGSGNTNKCFTNDRSLPITTWSSVKVTAFAGELIIEINSGGGVSQRKTESCEPYEPMKGDVGRLDQLLPWEGDVCSNSYVSYKRLGFNIAKGNLINSQLRISNGFHLSFNIKPHRGVPGWNSIIHVTETGEDHGQGSRQPAVFFHSRSTRLMVCAYCQDSMTTSKETCVSADYDLPLGKTSSVKISMEEDSSYLPDYFRRGTAVLTLTIDNAYKYSVFCGWPYEPSPTSWPYGPSSTAEMYYGNPWLSPADADLTNVVYTAKALDEYGRRRIVSEADRTIAASEPGAELQGELLPPAASTNQRA